MRNSVDHYHEHLICAIERLLPQISYISHGPNEISGRISESFVFHPCVTRISSSFPDFKRSGNDEFASLIATSWRCFPRTAFQQISCPDPGTFLSPWGSCNPCCDGQTFPSCSIAELLIAKRGEHKTENWTFRLNHLLVLVWGRLLELRTVWFTR